MRRSAFTVRLLDRPGALERFLGLVRRRAMKLDPVGIERVGSAGDRWSIEVVSTDDSAPLERYSHDIRNLVDVVDVTPPRPYPGREITDHSNEPHGEDR